MKNEQSYLGRRDYLKRLSPESYRSNAYVHWSMTIKDRKTGWLVPTFHYKFREILTHTMFRYALCCPIYCCMPDHFHLLWIGILEKSDQRKALRYFRKQLNILLDQLGVQLQKQPHDHVLSEDERDRSAFENVVEYIARNPERAGLIESDEFRDYPYLGSLIPGYPELIMRQSDFWHRFWRTYAYLRANGLMHAIDKE